MDPAILSIIIIAITVVSFALEKIPLAMTALLASLAMGIFGVMDLKLVYAGFASTTVMMVAGMLVIGNCIFETGLAEYVGNKLTGTSIVKNERLFLFVMMLFAAVASAFLSNSAVVATCIPLVGSIVIKSRGKIQNKYILMGVGMAAGLGGSGTIVGSTAQLAAQQILISTEGARALEFFELSYVVGPLCIILALYFATIGL